MSLVISEHRPFLKPTPFYGKSSENRVASLVAASLFVLWLQPLSTQAHNVDVAVVVHPDTPVSNLSLAEVRKIFLRDRQYWRANTPVVLLIRAPVARERDVVLKVIYQMSTANLQRVLLPGTGDTLPVLTSTIKREVRAFPEGLRHVSRRSSHGGLPPLHGGRRQQTGSKRRSKPFDSEH
jgi:hypothetical protein